MAERLKPCPFCGGEAKEFTGEDAAPHRWTVECVICGAHVGSDTRHRARMKWNRRAERTCRRVEYKLTNNLICSECGYGIPRALDRYAFMNYCPHCGARVVEEDS